MEAMQIAQVVELAGMASAVILGESSKPDEAVNRFRTAAHEWFDIKGTVPLSMLQCFSDKAQELARQFGLNVGETPDVEAILEEASKIRNEQSLPAMNVDDLLAAEAKEACDPVTGLPDKTVFVRDIDAAFAQLSESATGSGIGVIIALLDDAKDINFNVAPTAADGALKHVADSIGETGCRASAWPKRSRESPPKRPTSR
jgi:hypothetical protein